MFLLMRCSLLHNNRIRFQGWCGFCRSAIDLYGWYLSISHPLETPLDFTTLELGRHLRQWSMRYKTTSDVIHAILCLYWSKASIMPSIVVTKYLIKIIINIIFHFTPCDSPQPIKCMSPRAIGLRLLVSRADTGCYMEKVMYYSLCICCFYNPTPPKKYFFYIKTTCNTLVPTHESAIKIKKL